MNGTPQDEQEQLTEFFLCTYELSKLGEILKVFSHLHHVNPADHEEIAVWQKRVSQAFGLLSPVGAYFCFRLVWDLVLTGVLQIPSAAAFWTTVALALPTAVGFGAYINGGMQEFFENVGNFWTEPHTHHTWPKLRKALFAFGIGEAFFRVITEPALIVETVEMFPRYYGLWIGSAAVMGLSHLFMSMNEQTNPYAEIIPDFVDMCAVRCGRGELTPARMKTAIIKKLRALYEFTDRMPRTYLEAQQYMHAQFTEAERQSNADQ